MAIDFKSEKKIIDEEPTGPEWWKPSEGRHKVKFIDEGTSRMSQFNGEEKEQIVFKIEVNGSVKQWSVNKSKSKKSLWYQILEFGTDREGVVGKEMEVKILGSGRDRQYTVLN